VASIINGDPKDRKTFALGENYWTDEHNRNWETTVDQLNRVDDDLSALEADVNDLTTDVSDLDSRVTALEGFIGAAQGDFERLINNRSATKLAAGAASGDTTLDVVSTEMKLFSGDEIKIYDAEDGSVVGPVAVQADLAKGSSGTVLEIQALPSGVSANSYVMPELPVLAGGGGAFDDLDVRMSAVETDVSTLEAYVNGTESGELQYRLDNIESEQSSLRALINQESDRISAVQSRLSIAEDQISLSVTDYGITDEPIAVVNGQVDGTAVTTLPVKNLDLDVLAEDKLIVANPDGPPTFLEVDADVTDDGTADIPLAQSYELSLSDEQDVYLAPLSSRSAIEVLQGEIDLSVTKDEVSSFLNISLNDITVGTQYLHSNSFDGGTKKDGNNYTVADPDDLGDQGWALTNGGDLVALNAYLRGDLRANAGVFGGPIEMLSEGQIIDTDGQYRIDQRGFAVKAIPARTFQQGNMFSILNDQGEVIGRLSGKAPSRETTQLLSRDKLTIRSKAEAQLRSLEGDIRLTPASMLRLQTDSIEATKLKEYNGISEADTAFDNGNIEEGELWTDTSEGNAIKKYHDDTSTNDPTNKVVEFDASVSELTLYCNDESQVEGGTVDQVEWEFIDAGGTLVQSKSGAYVSQTFSQFQTVTVKHRVTWSDGTTSSWQSESIALVDDNIIKPIKVPDDIDRSEFR